MRKVNECPACLIEGEFLPLNKIDAAGNKLVYSGKPNHWKCSKCRLEWDINEDFNCIHCGKEVPGRILTCSEECYGELVDIGVL
jgi:hypothetical protein